MKDAIFNWMAENYPLLFVCILIAVVVWIVARFYFKDYRRVEDKVANLPCEHYSKLYNDMQIKLDRIITYLSTKYPTSAYVFSFKQRPRQLNQMGQRLLEKCGGIRLLEEHSGFFIKRIESYNPKTALDVELQAYEVLISNQGLELFDDIKQWVYNYPAWELEISGNKEMYSITMGDVCFVLSIPLRDRYLAAHSEVPILQAYP